MPNLIKNIIGEFHFENIGNTNINEKIIVKYDDEDYIEVYGFIGFLQNFKKVNDKEVFEKRVYHGLTMNKDKKIIELEIHIE